MSSSMVEVFAFSGHHQSLMDSILEEQRAKVSLYQNV